MSFLSVAFAAFLACALIVFYSSPVRWRPHVLLTLSLAFYCTWVPWHCALLLATTAVVFFAAQAIERRATTPGSNALRLVTLAITILLVVLVVFKCALALAVDLQERGAGVDSNALAWLAAPLGLSYYLFKLIGYLLDVYWGSLPPRRDFVSLALHTAFFPQIVSGPIQRAGDFFSQLDAGKAWDRDLFVTGLRRILFGLFKKIVVADPLAIIVSELHAHSAEHSSLELLLGAYGFSLQMYADFSGITDIALGVGLLFGIRGPENFARPFLAANLQEFWRRWHMSLTTWLTDYLFVPLRMTFRHLGNAGLALAIFINMVAIGVWHGPRWTYLVFGCINGVFMIVSALTLKRRNAWFRDRPGLARLRSVGGPLLTFHLVVFTHVFFQAADLHSALTYLGHLTHVLPHAAVAPWHLDAAILGPSTGRLALALGGLVAMEWLNWIAEQPGRSVRLLRIPAPLRWCAYYAAVAAVILSARGSTSFIYAQF